MRLLAFSPVLISLVVGCGSSPPPVTTPSVASSAGTTTAAPPMASAATAPAPEPAGKDATKAEAATPASMEHGPASNAEHQLEEDRAKWEEQNKAELARWTPEMHAEAKAIAEKKFASGKGAIEAVMKAKFRLPANAARDKYRHPAETLAFFGFKPTMTVLDVGPGEGWYTELLAPVLVPSGKYLATTTDPKGPATERNTFNGQKFQAFLDKAPEIYGKAETIVIDPKAPKLSEDGTVDLALIIRGVHGMKNNGVLDAWLAQIHRALKPGGVLGIVEHRAPKGADATDSAKKGYVPESWLIEQVSMAGFKLAGKSEVNANSKDTKDYPDGVWSLPPTFRGGDKDREKYAAIGESDRMTLKFVKVAPKPAAK